MLCCLYLNYWSNVCLRSAHILSSAKVMPLIYILEKYMLEQEGKVLIYSAVWQYRF
jgi:hypothetical protein